MNHRSLVIVVMAALALTIISPVGAFPAVPAWRMELSFTTEVAQVKVGGTVTITAELADTPALAAEGLGDRDGLKSGWGMLFVNNAPRVQTFWMRGMRFCLDIIWIEKGEITGAAENVCPQPGASDSELAVFSSGVPVTYVLEMPANWLNNHGFGAGTPVTITFPPGYRS